ncbi:MAG TPA: penicillin-binding transpeptidase domain-containing protein [Microthrixaceae bacterium]|nr:penicillin-binding transpeptidase domain-containing protein [Microthrixaceae bacterium]
MNKQIKALGIVIMVCYVALFLKLNQVQVLQADAYSNRPDNTRQLLRDFNQPRGDIITADGAVAATSEDRRASLRYQRIYPDGQLFSAVTGYYSFTLGSDGVERTYNEQLAGRTASLRLHRLSGFFSDTSSEGDVVLTVRKDIQETARDALGDRQGSVVALDPRTGAILAMWSSPTFDPNLLSSNDPDAAAKAKALYDLAPTKPLLPKAYRERYFPGSTFKVVTATAGLTSGAVTTGAPDYPVVTSYTPPLTTKPINNFDGNPCGGTLMTILAKSCNSSFAEMAAANTGPDPMIAAAEAAGFNHSVPLDLPRPAESVYPTEFGNVVSRPEGAAPVYEDTPKLAQTAIGQNDVRATPLQMALVAAGVGNTGQIMAPHVMAEIRAHNSDVVEAFKTFPWRESMTPDVAATMREAMVGVVNSGTATVMRTPGWEVGAKTGTAQLGTNPPRSHGWMIAFAGPPGEPAHVAVAVIVENLSGVSEATGGSTAGPVAKAVMDKALAVER